MNFKKTKISYLFFLFIFGIFGFAINRVYAINNTNFSQTISGTLGVNIVDGSGNDVASPTVSFSSVPFSMTFQTSSGILGSASQRIRVTNPTATPTWTVSIAATSGPAALWTGSSRTYDFNDSSVDATDGADADSVGGEMSIDPTIGNIAGVGSTSTTNVSFGTANSFLQGTRDSIDLMSASAGAQAPGQWDLTSVGVSQTIPAGQAAEGYSIQMTVTIV